MVVPKTETKSTSGSHLEEAVKADRKIFTASSRWLPDVDLEAVKADRKIFSGEFTVAID